MKPSVFSDNVEQSSSSCQVNNKKQPIIPFFAQKAPTCPYLCKGLFFGSNVPYVGVDFGFFNKQGRWCTRVDTSTRDDVSRFCGPASDVRRTQVNEYFCYYYNARISIIVDIYIWNIYKS